MLLLARKMRFANGDRFHKSLIYYTHGCFRRGFQSTPIDRLLSHTEKYKTKNMPRVSRLRWVFLFRWLHETSRREKSRRAVLLGNHAQTKLDWIQSRGVFSSPTFQQKKGIRTCQNLFRCKQNRRIPRQLTNSNNMNALSKKFFTLLWIHQYMLSVFNTYRFQQPKNVGHIDGQCSTTLPKYVLHDHRDPSCPSRWFICCRLRECPSTLLSRRGVLPPSTHQPSRKHVALSPTGLTACKTKNVPRGPP